MNAPCHDCAFTPGTEAAKCQPTRITADLCVVGREPFFCHAQNRPDAICQGWVREVAELEARGGYGDPRLQAAAREFNELWQVVTEPFREKDPTR